MTLILSRRGGAGAARPGRLAAMAACLALAMSPRPARAMEGLTAAEMGQQRGGFLVAGNVVFDFGAVVRTFENGALTLQTTLTWTPQGPQVVRFVGAGVMAAGPDAPAGAFITPGGATLVQNVTQGQILSLVLTPASNLDLRQETSVTVTLPGFGPVQADMLRQLSGLRLTRDLASGSVGALRF